MTTANSRLLKHLREAFENKRLEKMDRINFIRDHSLFLRNELTFRELVDSIRQPAGELREAMEEYYKGSAYRRAFKRA
ncbi:MAG: hypothetical protein JO102_06205 [Elusimicrobia bacterium]|nr:hypothetical protein [Elusimicrobiota bacterium]